MTYGLSFVKLYTGRSHIDIGNIVPSEESGRQNVSHRLGVAHHLLLSVRMSISTTLDIAVNVSSSQSSVRILLVIYFGVPQFTWSARVFMVVL